MTPEERRAYDRAYRKTEKGKAALRRYQQSEAGKAAAKRFKLSEKGKELQKRTLAEMRDRYHSDPAYRARLAEAQHARIAAMPTERKRALAHRPEVLASRARYLARLAEAKPTVLSAALQTEHSHSQAINAAIRKVDQTDYTITPAEEQETRDRILDVLDTLTYREREIIKLRYGIGDGYTYTLEEVGRIFKVTRERVRQVEAKAIRNLQHPRRKQLLQPVV